MDIYSRMIKYTGYNITFKGLEHLLDLKSRMNLVYGKDNLCLLEVHVQDESMKIIYHRRLGGMLKPKMISDVSKEFFTLKGKENVRTFKINNLFI